MENSPAPFSRPPERSPRTRPRSEDRRAELARIAYRLIAEKGLEGFRIRQVAEAAGIDQGTLHYHYSSKEALIQAVVDYLVADFRVNRVAPEMEPPGALDELLNELHDVALRVQQTPEQFRVLIDLRVHATRDPGVAEILANQDRGFDRHLTGILLRGIDQGIFRPDVDLRLAVLVLRSAMFGLGSMALLASERIDDIASALCSQFQAWLGKSPG